MALATVLDPRQSQRILAEGCLRNLRGDVECFHGNEVHRRFSTRLLHLRRGVLLAECPTERARDKPPEPGTPVAPS